MSKPLSSSLSSSAPPSSDPVHTLTNQIDRVKLSSSSDAGNREFYRSSSSGPSRSQVPTSLQPANGAQPYSLPSAPAQRMEMPVPMVAIQMPSLYTGESLTMSYARSPPPPSFQLQPPYASVPQFPISLTPPQQPASRAHSSFNSSIPRVPKINTIPVPNTRPRAASTPATPVSTSTAAAVQSASSTVQCAGVTKAGKRCTRQVKAPPLVSYFTSPDDEPIERLCFQHTKEVLQPTGFYSRKAGAGWVEFSDWIPEYLNSDTQAALRIEMERPVSEKDEDGYIYAYEIRDDRTPDEVHLKVGRSVKLVKRLDQWSKQCTSKEVVLRGWWPGTVESSDSGDDATTTSLLKGKVKAGEKGPFCHRLERLVHLELADLSVHAPYLLATTAPPPPTVSPGRGTKPVKTPRPNKPCPDCGTVHKEIFSFKRVKKGSLKNGEWEKIVKPVISKWGKFVLEYL